MSLIDFKVKTSSSDILNELKKKVSEDEDFTLKLDSINYYFALQYPSKLIQ